MREQDPNTTIAEANSRWPKGRPLSLEVEDGEKKKIIKEILRNSEQPIRPRTGRRDRPILLRTSPVELSQLIACANWLQDGTYTPLTHKIRHILHWAFWQMARENLSETELAVWKNLEDKEAGSNPNYGHVWRRKWETP